MLSHKMRDALRLLIEGRKREAVIAHGKPTLRALFRRGLIDSALEPRLRKIAAVIIPIRTWSEPNLRGHWGRRARRARKQREAARILVGAALAPLPLDSAQKTVVQLTRVAPRALDSDNLAAALKAIRDGVADALGLDDGDPRLVWLYGQRRGKPGEYAVAVKIAGR